MTKRTVLWSFVLILLLLIGAEVGGFIWLELKEGLNTDIGCDIMPKFCTKL